MTTIRLNCAICGAVELPAPDIDLILTPESIICRFSCPQCTEGQVKIIDGDDDLERQLIDAGCKHVWMPMEAAEVHDGPPITMDDVLDFSLSLGAGDFLAAMIE